MRDAIRPYRLHATARWFPEGGPTGSWNQLEPKGVAISLCSCLQASCPHLYLGLYGLYMDYEPRILSGMHIQRWMGWFCFRWRDGGKHLETIRNIYIYILSNGELNNIFFCEKNMVVFLICFGRKIRTTDVFLYSRNQPTIRYQGNFLGNIIG